MTPILWAVLALAAAFALVFLNVRRAARRLPPLVLPPGEALPATPLQRLSRFTLAAVLLFTLTAGGVVAHYGMQVWWESDPVRLTVTALLLGGLGVYGLAVARTAQWTRRGDGALDERDRAILASAPAGQAPAILVTLAVWMIGLVEAHQATHLMPTQWLYLVFWSCLMVSVLAQLAGVLVGYRRS